MGPGGKRGSWVHECRQHIHAQQQQQKSSKKSSSNNNISNNNSNNNSNASRNMNSNSTHKPPETPPPRGSSSCHGCGPQTAGSDPGPRLDSRAQTGSGDRSTQALAGSSGGLGGQGKGWASRVPYMAVVVTAAPHATNRMHLFFFIFSHPSATKLPTERRAKRTAATAAASTVCRSQQDQEHEPTGEPCHCGQGAEVGEALSQGVPQESKVRVPAIHRADTQGMPHLQ